MKITIETEVDAPATVVWEAWVLPEDITRWNYAIEEWCCPKAEIDLVVGGKFNYRMEAKDGSVGFDFEGEFTKIIPQKTIQYKLGDDREVNIEFIESGNRVKIIESFDAEDENSAQQQKQGWINILPNFKKHVEHKNE